MTLLLQTDHSNHRFQQFRLLPFVWLGGLFLGLFLYCEPASIFFSMMRRPVSVSIVGCFFSILFPFLLSTFVVMIHRPGLLLAVVFLKGCFFSYVSIGMLLCLGSGSWLIRLVFMLSDICSLPILYYFWKRFLRCGGIPSVSEILFGLCGLTLMVSMDYHIIIPFVNKGFIL